MERAPESAKALCVFVDEEFNWPVVSRSLPADVPKIVVLALGRSCSQINEIPGKTEITLKFVDSYGPSEPEARRKTMLWLRDWANQVTFEGATIKELSIYRGLSLWWFFDPWWAFLGGECFSYLHETIRRLEQIGEILNVLKPSFVISLCKNQEFNDVLKVICKHRRIGLSFPFSRGQGTSIIERRRKALLYFGRCVGRAVLYRVQALFAPRARENPLQDRLLVLSGDNWGHFWDDEANEMKEGDSYLYNVLRALKRRFSIRFVVELAARQLSIKGLRIKRQKSDILQKPFEAYLDAGALARSLRGYRWMRRRWTRLAASGEFRASLIYGGVPCWDFFGRRVKGFVTGGLFDALLSLEIGFSMLKKEQPKALVIDSRMSRFGRALIHASRHFGVPSIAIEHSFFLPDNVWDFLTAGDMSEQRRNPTLGCPLPDAILVYGSRDRELMIRGHFPAAIVEVIGAPRWDYVPSLARVLDKKVLSNSYGVDPERPIVLLTTQSYYPVNEEDQILRATSVAVKQVPGAQLVVKLHPLDRDVWATKRRYHKIAENLGLRDVVICHGRILYEVLRISDVLVALGCNTAIEASLMGKPVIIADFFGRELHDAFLKHPALLAAKTQEELSALIVQIFRDVDLRTELAAQRHEFISTYCYGADGLAWKRAVQIVSERIERARETCATANKHPAAEGLRGERPVSTSPNAHPASTPRGV